MPTGGGQLWARVCWRSRCRVAGGRPVHWPSWDRRDCLVPDRLGEGFGGCPAEEAAAHSRSTRPLGTPARRCRGRGAGGQGACAPVETRWLCVRFGGHAKFPCCSLNPFQTNEDSQQALDENVLCQDFCLF